MTKKKKKKKKQEETLPSPLSRPGCPKRQSERVQAVPYLHGRALGACCAGLSGYTCFFDGVEGLPDLK